MSAPLDRSAGRWWTISLVLALVLPPARAADVGGSPPARTDPRFGAVHAFAAPERAVEAGVRWERFIFSWADLQPSGPGALGPGPLSDVELDAQRARGITPVGIVIYTPAWATDDPQPVGASVPRNLHLPWNDPRNPWGQFFHQLVARYRGRVDHWIVWNEPDMWLDEGGRTFNVTFRGSVEELALLLKTAYLAGKAANPGATIALAGLAYWFDHEGKRTPYLQRLLDALARDPSAPANGWYFDALAVHPYSAPLNSFAIPLLQRKLLQARGLSKPLWIDESNLVPWDDPTIGLISPFPFRGTQDQQASYVVQSFALALAAGVERIALYQFRDLYPEGEQYFGIVRNDGTPRAAFAALRTVSTYFSGAERATYFWSGSNSPPTAAEIDQVLASNVGRYQFLWPGVVQQVVLERPGERVTVVWNATPTPVTARVAAAAPTATLVDKAGRARPLNARDGRYELLLASTRHNTDPRDRSLYLTGGDPWIIVEAVGPMAPAPRAPEVAPAPCFAETGYCIASVAFAEYFQRRGGVRTFGYPISREFDLLGSRVQLFQRQALQLGPDGNARPLNLLDPELLPYTRINGSTFPGVDPALKAATPAPSDPEYATRIVAFIRANAPDVWQGRPVNFGRTFFGTIGCADAFPNEPCREELLPLLNLEAWGAPLSAPQADPANHGFVYQRFQRGILHYDAATGRTQGILLGDYLKALLTGQGLPPDLEQQARGSPYLRQYDPASEWGLARPEQLLQSDLRGAFERDLR